jgi:Transposase DDE domain/Transposase domain (DUF772)
MSNLKQRVSNYLGKLQQDLFPFLEEHLDTPLPEKLIQLISILDMVEIEKFVCDRRGYPGRPPKNRCAMARAFIAKAVYKIPDTKALIDRLKSDKNLRKVCGFESSYSIPSEASFSRGFQEFTNSDLPQKTHEAVVTAAYQDEIVGHVSKDSTAIEVREKPVKKENEEEEPTEIQTKPKKRAPKGCAKKTRIEQQACGELTLGEMIKDLPAYCNIGRKTSSSGHIYAWIGYKLHLSVDDNGIPLAAIISSASMNDTQAAIPLAVMTANRVDNLYDLMDSGYYANAIFDHSRSLGHVPIIDFAAKGDEQKAKKEQEKLARRTLNWEPAEAIRYNIRTSVERANGRLKDEFGALTVRVKGAAKVFTHLMFGVLALAADQLLKLAT